MTKEDDWKASMERRMALRTKIDQNNEALAKVGTIATAPDRDGKMNAFRERRTAVREQLESLKVELIKKGWIEFSTVTPFVDVQEAMTLFVNLPIQIVLTPNVKTDRTQVGIFTMDEDRGFGE